MKSTAHTPTPWNFHVGDDYIAILKHKKNGNDLGIAMMGNPSAENQANAAFIVTACNAHDGLMCAAQAIIERSHGRLYDTDQETGETFVNLLLNAMTEGRPRS